MLDECLKNSGLAYVVKDGAIAIRPANEVNAVKAVSYTHLPVALILLAAFSMPRVISVASPQRACIQAPIDHTAMAHKLSLIHISFFPMYSKLFLMRC